jgi:hypothetical protein
VSRFSFNITVWDDQWFTRRYQYLTIAGIAIISSLMVYFPFIISGETDILFRYWDGPNYAYLAKAMYTIPVDHPLSPYTSPEYFAAHLPVYPLTIRLFSFMGYNNAMLFTTVLYTTLAAIVLYQLLLETNTVRNPLWSAIISLFLPARYLIYHSLGATEAPFIFFTLSSLLAYTRGQYILAFVLGGITGITRITGILIGGAFFVMLVWERKWKYIPALALVGLPLLMMFGFYHIHYGDFFAYFGTNLSDTNKLIHIMPFDIFLNYSDNGDAHSSEFYLMMYALYGVGTALLWSKNKLFFWYCLITMLFSIFIFHQDLSRYLIPLAPLALVVAYDDILSRKALKFAAIPFVALSFVFAWGMLPHNMIDEHTYKGLVEELEREDVDAEERLNSLFSSDISLTACGYGKCTPGITKWNKSLIPKPKRGLNIYAYQANGTVEKIAHFDHCLSGSVYEKGVPLNAIIDQLQPQPEKIILLSTDTVSCNNKPIQGLDKWFKGFDFNALKYVEFRMAYLAVIETSTNEVIELTGKEKVHFSHSE